MLERGYSNARVAVFGVALLLILTGCSSLSRAWLSEDVPGGEPAAATQAADSPFPEQDTMAAETPDTAAVSSIAADAAPSVPRPVVRLGTGQFVNPDNSRRYQVTATPAGDISLNFEAAELRQVVKMILGDLLGETYYMDPTIKGTVTVQNDNSLRHDQLLPILEELLQMNGAALMQAPAGYKIVPLTKAERQALPPSASRWPPTSTRGYTVQIIPLEFAAADEVAKVLEPYVPEGGSLRAVPQRNILILAAPGHSIEEFIQTVRVFDADWLEGMTMGMFTLTYADAATVASELEQLLDPSSGSPMAGMVRLFPIERLNALLVVTPQRRYLQEVRAWIEDLDRGGDAPGRRLYIYHVKNSKAQHIAQVLSEVFLSPPEAARVPLAASIAPGLQTVSIAAPPQQGQQRAPAGTDTEAVAPAPPVESLPPALGERTLMSDLSSVKIIADTLNNTLLVMATRAEYAHI